MRGYVWDDYFESYLARMFDCRSIASIDASSFEGAEIIHDMNRPISTELESKFDLVVDGGSLEHIFNFPVAVSNLMRMAVVGGFVMTSNPANNLCGHGFYQLSPELMYRSFSAKNGFRIQ